MSSETDDERVEDWHEAHHREEEENPLGGEGGGDRGPGGRGGRGGGGKRAKRAKVSQAAPIHAPVTRGNHKHIRNHHKQQLIRAGTCEKTKIEEKKGGRQEVVEGADPEDHVPVLGDLGALLDAHHQVRE